MQTIQETLAMTGSNRYGVPFQKLDIRKQLTVLIDVLGGSHLHRNKPVAFKTKKERAFFVHQVVGDLHRAGLQIRNIMNLDQRHIQAVVDSMVDSGKSPGTIAVRLSLLSWLGTAIGKRGLVLAPEKYGLKPEQVKRDYAATTDKSWSAAGVVTDEMIAKAMEMDRWAGTSLSLMKEFGLRVTEAILIKPRSADTGAGLWVLEGTKGGRPRFVPFRTEAQRLALDRAKELSMQSRRGALVPPGKDVVQARSRIYYVCKKIGMAVGDIRLKPHGLRHGFANDLYEDVAGAPSVVRGGSRILDSAADERARHAVTEALGHSRPEITAAYTGPGKRGRPRSNAGQGQGGS